MDNEESELDHHYITSPVYNYRGDAIEVIDVVRPMTSTPDDSIDHIARNATLAAHGTSNCMGYVD